MKPIFSIFSGIAIFSGITLKPNDIISYDILSSFASDIQNGIIQAFSLLGQFVGYLIDAPTNAWDSVVQNFGYAFKPYGEIIPIMLVIVLAVTVMVVTIILQTSKSIEEGANPSDLMEGME